MDNFQRLLEQCASLKECIRKLKLREVSENQKAVKRIQLSSLQEQLSEVGRKLKHLALYRREEND